MLFSILLGFLAASAGSEGERRAVDVSEEMGSGKGGSKMRLTEGAIELSSAVASLSATRGIGFFS